MLASTRRTDALDDALLVERRDQHRDEAAGVDRRADDVRASRRACDSASADSVSARPMPSVIAMANSQLSADDDDVDHVEQGEVGLRRGAARRAGAAA